MWAITPQQKRKIMKTKILLVAALLGTAVMSANAGVRFGLSIGLPTVVVATTPVYAAPVIVAPAPVTVVQSVPAPPMTVVETVPASPGVGYVWSPGYYTGAHVWVGGSWIYHPVHFDHGHGYYHYDRGGYRR
jgi:hypothetical protein